MVITSLTRNQVAPQKARGFKSHRLRQPKPVDSVSMGFLDFQANLVEIIIYKVIYLFSLNSIANL